MKKLLSLLAIAGMLSFGTTNAVAENGNANAKTELVQQGAQSGGGQTSKAKKASKSAKNNEKEDVDKDESFHKIIKDKYVEGGPEFMGVVLIALILGLAICIERIIYLNLSTTNTTKLIKRVEDALQSGGIDAAKEICRNTKGPVASIFYQGLERSGEGLDIVEKSIVSYGSVMVGRLEKNTSWISLFIALAPMLGFMGTVIGMIGAFDAIEAAGDISPSLVAGGIKVALLTTVFGLIVAMILQVFYNYIIAKIDSLVNDMENASITFMDILAANKK